MSYRIYIRRFDDTKADYINHPLPISLEEWLSVVESDPELQTDVSSLSETKLPTAAIWLADPDHDIDDYQRLFWYSEYTQAISTKNVESKEVIAKMRELATKLRAHVIGEEGEEDWNWDVSNL
jgi:hypothetical protein